MDYAQQADTDKHFYLLRQLEIAQRNVEKLEVLMAELAYSSMLLRDTRDALEKARAAYEA